jgi:hypothetical protein
VRRAPFYTDVFVLPLPPGHRFPMEKYARLRQRLLSRGEFLRQRFPSAGCGQRRRTAARA